MLVGKTDSDNIQPSGAYQSSVSWTSTFPVPSVGTHVGGGNLGKKLSDHVMRAADAIEHVVESSDQHAAKIWSLDGVSKALEKK